MAFRRPCRTSLRTPPRSALTAKPVTPQAARLGTEQGVGEVSGLDQGRETTSSDPTERCGEPAFTVDSSAQLGSVLQISHIPEFPKSYTGPMACEERSFTDLVTLGWVSGVRRACEPLPTKTTKPRSQSSMETPRARLRNHLKHSHRRTLSGNAGKARVPVTPGPTERPRLWPKTMFFPKSTRKHV